MTKQPMTTTLVTQSPPPALKAARHWTLEEREDFAARYPNSWAKLAPHLLNLPPARVTRDVAREIVVLQQMLDDLERENKKLRHRLGCFNSVVPTPTLAHAYVEAFCDGNLVCRKEMITSGRRRSVAYPRMALCWYLNKHTDMSLSSIGRMVGHKDHSTVIHAIRRVEADPQFNRYIELAEQWLAERALLPEDGQKIMVDAR